MRRTFKDEAGREWRLKVHVPAAKRVRDDVGVDLLEVGDGQLVKRLIEQPADLVGVLWVLVEQQAKQQDVSPEAFGEGLCGEAIDSAIDCLFEALCDFFPPSKRAVLRAAMEKVRQTEQRAQQESLKALQSPELQQMLDDAVGRIGNTFTGLAASSASTPAATPSPTANSSG